MTYKTYAEFVRSADEHPFELFRARWLLLPDCESITGWNRADLDHGTELLQEIYNTVNRPISDIRAACGLTQQAFAAKFAIPLRTVQNWESRDCCPVYVRVLIQQALDLADLPAMLGVIS